MIDLAATVDKHLARSFLDLIPAEGTLRHGLFSPSSPATATETMRFNFCFQEH